MAQLSQHNASGRSGLDTRSFLGSFRGDSRADAIVGWLRRFLRELAAQDILIATYFALLFLAIARGTGPSRGLCAAYVAVDLGVLVGGLVLTRGGFLRRGTFAHGLVYRASVFVGVLASYFQMRDILPAVNPGTIDAKILAFDLHVFGYEPAVAWDRFVTPATTEWFAFFYFLYFILLIAHVLPMMLACRDTAMLSHFALGAFMVFCVGHFGYTLVPGYGPYRHLAGHFTNELQGGTFWRLARATVDAGGAQKDIFPSLHTAVPTFFAIFSFMHRDAKPFKYTWPVMGLIASQIIVATMFLRWHWVIDVIVGFTLSATSAIVSHKVVAWEARRRRARGVSSVFQPLPHLTTSNIASR